MEIDALRGIAALCVVVFHLKVMTAHPGGLIGLDNPLGRWGNDFLWTAVDLFFVISGFIFAHVYLRDGRLKRATTLSDYTIARVARIYPLHFLTLLIVAAIVWAGAPLAPTFDRPAVFYDGYHFALNLLMLQASGIERGFSFNSPSWSLTSEFVCYALFFLLARAGGRWLLIGAVLAIGVGVGVEVGLLPLPLPSRIARGLVGFFVGFVIHRYRLQLQRIPLLLVVAFALGMAVAAPLSNRLGVNAGIFMALFAWPWVVLACLHPLIVRPLQTRPMQFLGDLSYSIYLIHIPLALVFLALNGGKLFAIADFAWLVPLYITTLFVLSWLSFAKFERPARRTIRDFSRAAFLGS